MKIAADSMPIRQDGHLPKPDFSKKPECFGILGGDFGCQLIKAKNIPCIGYRCEERLLAVTPSTLPWIDGQPYLRFGVLGRYVVKIHNAYHFTCAGDGYQSQLTGRKGVGVVGEGIRQ